MDDPEKPRSLARRALPVVSAILLVAALYDGGIFYSRWNDNRARERTRAAGEVEKARRIAELNGGDALKILSFNATAGSVAPGGHATVCYGVNAAKTVRLEPAVEEVWPALSHCFEVSPRRDTEYKLMAEDGKGHSVSESLVIKVRR